VEAAVTAALLHDVVDDTDVRLEAVAAEFGARVAGIVAQVSQLSNTNQLLRRQRRKLVRGPMRARLARPARAAGRRAARARPYWGQARAAEQEAAPCCVGPLAQTRPRQNMLPRSSRDSCSLPGPRARVDRNPMPAGLQSEIQGGALPALAAEDEECLRTMILTMVHEPLVIVVKLADRLHNMRTVRARDRSLRSLPSTFVHSR